ncbi:hypothetical protein SAMN05421812_13445 [Asanoa hainanensis]|uniref:Uncharacterized protein n=1 Tax=Asanoa hainanensis TaxID=560556 RepID=A0A239PHY8_9ACTN|nr:hypothetical protein SAMN05421812_13445 [Asanoa hainanensis]
MHGMDIGHHASLNVAFHAGRGHSTGGGFGRKHGTDIGHHANPSAACCHGRSSRGRRRGRFGRERHRDFGLDVGLSVARHPAAALGEAVGFDPNDPRDFGLDASVTGHPVTAVEDPVGKCA